MEKRKGGMKDQSHIEAMREAVRGDLERARNRRPSIFERPAPPPAAVPEPEPEPEPEPVVATVEPEFDPEPEPEPVVAEDPPAPKRRFTLAFWRR